MRLTQIKNKNQVYKIKFVNLKSQAILPCGRRELFIARKCEIDGMKRSRSSSNQRDKQESASFCFLLFFLRNLPVEFVDRLSGSLPSWSARWYTWARAAMGAWRSAAVCCSWTSSWRAAPIKVQRKNGRWWWWWMRGGRKNRLLEPQKSHRCAPIPPSPVP